MEGLPELEKKDFASVLTNASPQGRAGWGEGLRLLGMSVLWLGLIGSPHSREPSGKDAGAGCRAAGDGS